MRVVLDTNVFVSGVFFGGLPGQILEAWRSGRIRPVLSAEIFEEYGRVVDDLKARYSGVDLEPFLTLLAVEGEIVEAPPLAEPVSSDPEDDKFLACALAAGLPSSSRGTPISSTFPAGAASAFFAHASSSSGTSAPVRHRQIRLVDFRIKTRPHRP